ncbi:MAG: hypothetical protein ACRDQB_08735 [Thermocrispum sp.]
MKQQALVRGAVAGMVGGVVMAMWSMLALLASGEGFWTPLNLIAHTFWRGAPLDGTFSFGALVLGLVVHMIMSMMLGVLGAAAVRLVRGVPSTRGALAALGMAVGLVVWLVMQFAIWQAVDEAAAEAFTPWIFAVGHLMYGAVTGFGIAQPSRATATA